MFGNTDSFHVFLSKRKGDGKRWQLPQYCFASFSPLLGSCPLMDMPETVAQNRPMRRKKMNILPYEDLIVLTFSNVRINGRPPLTERWTFQ
jgi:hypothetical protein